MAKTKEEKTIFVKRIIMSVVGVIFCGVAVSFFKTAAFGVDPFQSLMAGLDAMIPISYGTLYVIVNAILLLFSIIADRHQIGIATFINLFLLGYIVDGSMWIFGKVVPEPNMGLRIIFMLIGILMICFSCALYMTADLGVSTYDAVSIVMADKWHWGKRKYLRVATDFVCVVAGGVIFVLAGRAIKEIPTIIGVGTIITAFFMGPLIDLFSNIVAKPLLYGKKKAE